MSKQGRICVLLLGLLTPHATWGADAPELPSPTPEGTDRVITADDATSTSQCVGNPVSALCAVETLLACIVRRKKQLCDVAVAPPTDVGTPDVPTYKEIRFRVVSAEILVEERFPWSPDKIAEWVPGFVSAQVGDTRLDLDVGFCFPYPPYECDDDRITYVVRKYEAYGGRWLVVGWQSASYR